MNRVWKHAWVAVIVMLALAPAWGQEEAASSTSSHTEPNWGLRVGFGNSPDQLIVGGQYDFGALAGPVHFDPQLELGFGDDSITLVGTVAFVYPWKWMGGVQPFAGGGPALGLVRWDHPNKGSTTDFEIALKILGGARWQLKRNREFFLELDLIVGDLHDVQVMAGWRF